MSLRKVTTLKISVKRLMFLLLMEVKGKTLPVRYGQVVKLLFFNVFTLDNLMIVDMLNDAS